VLLLGNLIYGYGLNTMPLYSQYMNKIPKQTRNNIFDILKIESVYWAGLLDELDLLNRIFDLKKLPSEDPRFENMAGD
jgi:hypothetical protein